MNLMSSIAKKLAGLAIATVSWRPTLANRQDLELVRDLGGDHPDHGRIDIDRVEVDAFVPYESSRN